MKEELELRVQEISIQEVEECETHNLLYVQRLLEKAKVEQRRKYERVRNKARRKFSKDQLSRREVARRLKYQAIFAELAEQQRIYRERLPEIRRKAMLILGQIPKEDLEGYEA